MEKRQLSIVVGIIVVVGALGITIGRYTAPNTTSTTSLVTTTTSPSTQPQTAIWPFASSHTRFTTPVSAARSFAVTYLGFTNPLVGSFQAGDNQSGEFSVRATASGQVTTIMVRKLTRAQNWWVLGAATHDAQLSKPATLEKISSPVMLTGMSTAFEAVVNVAIREDGVLTPLCSDVVMGGSMGTMSEFSKSLSFVKPSTTAGAIVFRILSAKDGSVVAAAAQRIGFKP